MQANRCAAIAEARPSELHDGSFEDAEAAARDLFATLGRVRPEGLRYASTRVVDSSTFVAGLDLLPGTEAAPLHDPGVTAEAKRSPSGYVDAAPRRLAALVAALRRRLRCLTHAGN
jgi:hypothetical protein